MKEYKPFNNPYPLTYSEDEETRELFNRIAARIKEGAAEQGEPISDDDAIKAARNLIGYVELGIKITKKRLREGKVTEEEIRAAKKLGEKLGVLDSEGREIEQKKRKLKHPEPQS